MEDLVVKFQNIMVLLILFITFHVTNCREYDVLILGAGASGLGKKAAQNAEVSLNPLVWKFCENAQFPYQEIR